MEIEAAYNRYKGEYELFRSKLIDFESCDLGQTNLSLEDAMEFYNDAAIVKYKLQLMEQTFAYQSEQLIKPPRLFNIETYNVIRPHFDLIEAQVLRALCTIHNMDTIKQRAKAVIERYV